jgi:hypothetical protein
MSEESQEFDASFARAVRKHKELYEERQMVE